MKLIVFGSHDLTDVKNPSIETVSCAACGMPMRIGEGSRAENVKETLPPPKKEDISVAFDKKCFVKLVRVFMNAVENRLEFEKQS